MQVLLKYEPYKDAIYIQFLGQRGVGKSSLLNFLLKKLGSSKKAKVGSTETTLEMEFFDVTEEIWKILLARGFAGTMQAFAEFDPQEIRKIFLVDQPGVGGLQINRASYMTGIIFYIIRR